jgi:hypothetical protein
VNPLPPPPRAFPPTGVQSATSTRRKLSFSRTSSGKRSYSSAEVEMHPLSRIGPYISVMAVMVARSCLSMRFPR